MNEDILALWISLGIFVFPLSWVYVVTTIRDEYLEEYGSKWKWEVQFMFYTTLLLAPIMLISYGFIRPIFFWFIKQVDLFFFGESLDFLDKPYYHDDPPQNKSTYVPPLNEEWNKHVLRNYSDPKPKRKIPKSDGIPTGEENP